MYLERYVTGSMQRWNFFPFPRSLWFINTCSSEWTSTWIRSHKRQFFSECSIFYSFMKDHNIVIPCTVVISIFISWLNIVIHWCISVSLQYYCADDVAQWCCSKSFARLWNQLACCWQHYSIKSLDLTPFFHFYMRSIGRQRRNVLGL